MHTHNTMLCEITVSLQRLTSVMFHHHLVFHAESQLFVKSCINSFKVTWKLMVWKNHNWEKILIIMHDYQNFKVSFWNTTYSIEVLMYFETLTTFLHDTIFYLYHRLDKKSNKKDFRISALASKKSSNQKTLLYNHAK